MKQERNIALAVCAVLAALILLLTSQSSPLYPINLWGDANCLFTVGRVMKDGGVLYRDIYEQKARCCTSFTPWRHACRIRAFGACTSWKRWR